MALSPAADLEGFLPSESRGLRLDQRFHADLAASLAHLAQSSIATEAAMSDRLMAAARSIRRGQRLPPLAFRSYFRLTEALLTEDIPAAEGHLVALEATGARPLQRTIRHIGQAESEAIRRELAADGMRLAPISAEESNAFCELLHEGFALLQRALPELHGEIAAIVHEVLLAQAPPEERMQFDGASHYQFWGLLLLNPIQHLTPLAVVEVLAHEACHSLLFGLTVDEPLVLHTDAELYPSPLRPDARPMDGVYHATYVSARMCWAMEGLAASTLISAEDRAMAREAACRDREHFASGLAVVDAHGRLSATGARILDSARAWMAGC